MKGFLYALSDWRDRNREAYLIALLVSGSPLMGSSIAYPMLSQVMSGWALVALVIFFLSAICFNAINTIEIVLYGHYTLVVGIFWMLLVLAWGNGTLDDYFRLIPIYTTAMTLLTAAWPSLLKSLGCDPRDIEDIFKVNRTTPTYVAMSGIQVDPDYPDYRDCPGPAPSLCRYWLQNQDRHRSSPVPISYPPSVGGEDISQEEIRRAPPVLIPLELQHVGPLSDRSGGPAHTGTSLSLSSRPSCPSELSTIVIPILQPEGPTRTPRTTGRRHDINALGRIHLERTGAQPSQPPQPVVSASLTL